MPVALCASAVILATAATASAQSSGALATLPVTPAGIEPYLHGVPSGTATGSTLPLSIADAVTRGLDHNLGALMAEQQVRTAEGDRWKALSDTLPRVGGTISESSQEVDLAAFGFTGFPGLTLPTVVGPFTVFNARLAVSAPLFDREAQGHVQQRTADVRAEQHTAQHARELVVLAVANLYMQALADQSRVTTMRTQIATAEALFTLVQDQRAAGTAAGIDVLRQQVELETAQQRQITATNEFEKQKLRLARAIGLPIGQAFELTDRMTYTPAPAITVDVATAAAMAQREDLKSAGERVNAALADRQAAHGAFLPTVRFDGDYGAIGPSISTAQSTYTAAAAVRIPLFEGGNAKGKVLQADAEVKERQAEYDDLKAGVSYDVQSALLDLNAADAAVKVATSAQSLAEQQITQARDRFAAGISNTIELAQAQDVLAAANDNYIVALYAHMMGKAALAHAMGASDAALTRAIGGSF